MKKKIILIFILTVLFGTLFVFENKSFVKANEHSHTYDNGICECGSFEEPEYFQHIPSGWIVENAGQLLSYVNKYNSGESKINLYIKADITLPSDYKWVPIGTTEHPFVHDIFTVKDVVYKIDLGNQEVTTSNFGLIGVLGDTSDRSKSIENLSVHGNFSILSSADSVGALVGNAKGKVEIFNSSSHVNMTMGDVGVGSTSIGGVVGKSSKELVLNKVANFGNLCLNVAYEGVGGVVGTMSAGALTNVINYGNIEATSAKYLGGLIGSIDSSNFDCLTNSVNLGRLKGKSFDISFANNNYVMNPGDLVGFLNTSSNSFVNNYYVNENAYGVVINDASMTDATKTNDEEITSGKLAYFLGSAYGQKIDNLAEGEERETYPVLGSDIVYQVYNCDGKTFFYSNTNQNMEHSFNYASEDNAILVTCDNCDFQGRIELVVLNPLYYDKTVKEVTLQTDIEGIDLSQIEVNYNTEVIFPGTYLASFTYMGLSASLEFKVLKGIPDKSMLNYHPLEEELIYDGNNKEVNLYSSNEPGLGEIVVSFVKNGKEVPLCEGGTYSVRVAVKEGKYYQAHEFNALEIFNIITVKPKEVTLEWTKTTLFYEEGNSIYTPSYVIKGLCYQDKPIVSFSQIGSGIGTFTTTISLVSENYQLVGDNLTTSFTVKKMLVETPIIEPALFKNGVTQVANIKETEYYTVKENKGGVSASRYPVVLELKDPSKYTWETTDSATLTVYFYIYTLESSWTTYPTISDWTYGEAPILPTYEVSNSYLDISVMYRSIGGIYSRTIPTEVGEYEVIFISEKEDARAFPLDDVVLTFNINKANPLCGIDSVFTVDYGTKLSDIELLGFGDGIWTFVGDVNQIYPSGEHKIELLFTPANTKNYNILTKTVTLIVNKLEVMFEAPSKIDGLVYNNTNQALVIPGNVIGGDLYYKVNDGEWSKELPSKKEAGKYEVAYKVIGKDNYHDIEEENFVVEIKKVDITVEALNQEVEQYLPLPVLDYKVTGLVNNDVLDVNILVKVAITDTLTTGEYDITFEEVVSANYNITYKKGTLKVFEHTNCTGGNPTCTEKAICEVCHKEYGSLSDHIYSDYHYNNDATTEKDGTMSSKCAHCDETNTLVVPNTKLENANINPTSPSKTALHITIGAVVGIILATGVCTLLYFTVIKKKITK